MSFPFLTEYRVRSKTCYTLIVTPKNILRLQLRRNSLDVVSCVFRFGIKSNILMFGEGSKVLNFFIAYLSEFLSLMARNWKKRRLKYGNHVILRHIKGTLMQIWKSAKIPSSYENSMLKISHWSAFYFLRYAHFRYVKRLFTNIQEQNNMLKIA